MNEPSNIKEVKAEIAIKIREYRKKAGLQQKELAEKVAVGRSTISLWELGQRSPDMDTLVKIADILGCSPSSLFGKFAEDDNNAANKKTLPPEVGQEQSAERSAENDRVSEIVGLFSQLTADQQELVLSLIKGLLSK